MFPVNQIYTEDCVSTMQRLPDNVLPLTVTSPPYNCGRQYAGYADNKSWEEYWSFTEQWTKELFRITQVGGRLAVNLPWWMGKKPRRDAVSEFKRVATTSGWLFIDKIIWVKGNSTNLHTSGGYGGGGCGWGTYLSPSGPSIRCASEPILIFAKNQRGRQIVSDVGHGVCKRGDMTKEEWFTWTLDVWFVRGSRNSKHPATFPEEIPKRLIQLYTYPGEVVFDPFCGSGITLKAALHKNRKFIGTDVSPEYTALAQSVVNQ